MVKLTIDGRDVEVAEHTTILEAALAAGIRIPTLCYLKNLNEIGSCRVCVVEVEGIDQLVAACNNYVLDGMVVHTNSPSVRIARKVNVEFLLSQHDSECTSCVRSGNCSLQTLSNDLGIAQLPFDKHLAGEHWNLSFPLIRNNDKCIKCMRCIQVCDKVQATGVWDITNRAGHTMVNTVGGKPIEETGCSLCGQCITHCPVGALRERDDTEQVFDALGDPERICLVQIAPAVRTAWGETFGLAPGQATVERLAAALRMVGFDYIFDTSFSADLTIMEEASELLERLKRAGESGEHPTFPMFTSCCPGWVRYVKDHYPELVDQLSTSKSPQQMFGAIAKTYYAQALGVDPSKIFSVSIMPCVAKKAEAALPSMTGADGAPDVDVALTVREVCRMVKACHIDVAKLDDEPLDQPLGTHTGAGVAFGSTGGVMDAALRSAYYFATGERCDADAFSDVRGMDGWKEATFTMGDKALKVAVVHGLANARNLLDALKSGEVGYDFVEVMACPGGCVGGGGQPIHDGMELAGERGEVLWGLDRSSNLRRSYENPAIQMCYADYLGAPLSERAEELLHTDQRAWTMPGEREECL
ncbi:hydrogenase, Fe-only [Coriobacterium glomerans PW2]|uniref:Hydrogenase, Fe-only n=1 Tax=Coriobacterium glomerans (strain ATCC 49209 / DSM 20642 / JCM 10262 / PW2) TaxID=700015 RepID=F2N7Q9_CORGP|nr:NADH-dependent [FeFe] hydrogenase, group A6 [Coriobacterium glomerans]AEB06951.1 hydrogenase, Fe-only [Coriobacterium glomerans PW2]